ncbi:MAG: ribosomal protein S18-alanine N-acetyltransferase [Neisseriaceae bacterium]|nr:ribosomal protein S18-alanine N-acetyltransferase [Neisseriaceae bacterium]
MTIIRPALEQDLADILYLNTHSNPHPWAEHHFQAALDNNQIQVFENNQQIIACAIWQSVLDEAELHLIITHHAFRRQGIAQKLIQSFIQENPHIHKILLEVRENNQIAINLYKKQGFKQIGERKNYYLFPIENALIMEKKC